MEGAIERPACDAQREAVLAQLANLPADTDPADDAGRILADYLGNVGRAWRAATPEERNQIARQLFADVWVVNKTAVAVVPPPAYRPFLELAGADAQVRDALSTAMSLRRKRRASLSSPRHGCEPIAVCAPPPRRTVGRCGRSPSQADRPRRLNTDQITAIRALAQTKSLRSLAAEFGVSHETIRTMLRSRMVQHHEVGLIDGRRAGCQSREGIG